MILICDESGSKGYSNNSERTKGELGVIAGYLISEEQSAPIKKALDDIQQQFINGSDGKLHITDLSPDQQQNLRNEIWKCFRKNNVVLLYEAIYVEGFHKAWQCKEELFGKIPPPKPPHPIKLPKHRTVPESLHSQLFQGLTCKAIAWCKDNQPKTTNLDIITDRVEKEMLNQFYEGCDEIKTITDRKIEKIMGYDTGQRKKIKIGELLSHVTMPNNWEISLLGKLDVKITEDNSGLTLAADVLSNSLFHYFNEKNNVNLGLPLHKVSTLDKFELTDQIYGCYQDGEMPWLSDTLFGYPSQEK